MQGRFRPAVARWCAYSLASALFVGLASGCQVHVAFGTPKPKERTEPAFAEPDTALVRRAPTTVPGPSRPQQRTVAPAASSTRYLAAEANYKSAPDSSRFVGRSQNSSDRIRRASLQRTAAPQSPPAIFLDDNDTFQGDGKTGLSQPRHVYADSDAGNSASPGVTVASLDLAGVLHLTGAESWMVHLAAERVREAEANLDAAKAMWLPSLNAGIGWTKHDGQIQATNGQVVDISRNSLFVGGGAVLNNAPTTGGAGGPARMFVDLSLADAIFAPKAACQLLAARQSGQIATFNDTLLSASLAYTELVRAQDAKALAEENLKLVNKLLKLTTSFERSGKGTKADIARVEVEVARTRQDIVNAELAIRVASAELARILRIDTERAQASVELAAKDSSLLQVDLIPPGANLQDLIAQAVAQRPEITETDAEMFAARARSDAERWRPLIPNLHVGLSTGGFGGGVNDTVNGLDGRADVDVIAVWQVRNLGFGTAAARRRARSQLRQADYNRGLMRDRIVAEVSTAHAQVQAAVKQLAIAGKRVERAEDSYKKNETRIRNLQGLPLEVLQSVTAVIQARQQKLASAAAYNRAQLRLLRAIGRAISSGASAAE